MADDNICLAYVFMPIKAPAFRGGCRGGLAVSPDRDAIAVGALVRFS